MLSIVVGDLKVPQGGNTRIGGRVCKRHSQLLIVPMEQRLLCVFIHWAPVTGSDWWPAKWRPVSCSCVGHDGTTQALQRRKAANIGLKY